MMSLVGSLASTAWGTKVSDGRELQVKVKVNLKVKAPSVQIHTISNLG